MSLVFRSPTIYRCTSVSECWPWVLWSVFVLVVEDACVTESRAMKWRGRQCKRAVKKTETLPKILVMLYGGALCTHWYTKSLSLPSFNLTFHNKCLSAVFNSLLCWKWAGQIGSWSEYGSVVICHFYIYFYIYFLYSSSLILWFLIFIFYFLLLFNVVSFVS